MTVMQKIYAVIERYLNLFEKRALPLNHIKYIEKVLSIKLPEELKHIMSVFDGYCEIAHQSFFSFNSTFKGWNIVEKTLFYRKSDCKLPQKYLALREEGENFIVLNTETKSVLWCSLSDAYQLKEGERLLDQPTIFPTFTDFFEYLVTEEEKERGINQM